MSAECLTRPQYVPRSYCEAGSSRFPGSEADIATSQLVDSRVRLLVFFGTRKDLGARGARQTSINYHAVE